MSRPTRRRVPVLIFRSATTCAACLRRPHPPLPPDRRAAIAPELPTELRPAVALGSHPVRPRSPGYRHSVSSRTDTRASGSAYTPAPQPHPTLRTRPSRSAPSARPAHKPPPFIPHATAPYATSGKLPEPASSSGRLPARPPGYGLPPEPTTTRSPESRTPHPVPHPDATSALKPRPTLRPPRITAIPLRFTPPCPSIPSGAPHPAATFRPVCPSGTLRVRPAPLPPIRPHSRPPQMRARASPPADRRHRPPQPQAELRSHPVPLGPGRFWRHEIRGTAIF